MIKLKITYITFFTLCMLSTIDLFAEKQLSALLIDLSHVDSKVRHDAVVAIGRLGDTQGIDPLILQLADPEYAVRGAAVDALGVLRAHKAQHEIMHLLTSDPHEEVRQYAAIALRSLGDATAADVLIEALSDEHEGTRHEVIKTIGKLRITNGRDHIRGLLGDKNPLIRESSLSVLGSIGDASVIEAVTRSLRDREFRVRMEAARTLGKLNAQDSVSELKKSLKDSHEEVSLAAAVSLAMMHNDSGKKTAQTYLEHTDPLMRKTAVEVFKLIGKKKDIGELKFMQENDPVRSVQSAARRAIASIHERYPDN
ncbi:MAG: HEAT repeat domain-containing protein [bacterium]